MGQIRYKVKCVETGEIYSSLTKAAKAKNISPSNLCSYLKYKMDGTRGGYHWEIVEKELPPKILCKETGKIYSTQKEAADDIGCCRSSVGYAIRTKTPVFKHHFTLMSKDE